MPTSNTQISPSPTSNTQISPSPTSNTQITPTTSTQLAPMRASHTPRADEQQTPSGADVTAAIAPILLAEDDDELRRVLALTLRESGYQVMEASDGFELLDRIEAAIAWGGRAHPPISLIITDVRMPGMTGIDVLSILRLAYWATPVILMTAFVDPTMRLEAFELGAAAVIVKPFDLTELQTAVRSALRRTAPRSPRPPLRRRPS